MNHFLISYSGNKRGEMKTIKYFVDLTNIENIIEPFCGSSAFSFYIWLENQDKNINYYLNDNDILTHGIYDFIKKKTKEEIENEVNEMLKDFTQEKFKEVIAKKKNKTMMENLCFVLCSRGQMSIYKKREKYKLNKNQIKFIEFIKLNNVNIINKDWREIYENHKDNEKSFVFFDPPYILSYNLFYNDLKTDINPYEYFWINDLNNQKCKIMFVLEKIWFINLLFKNNIKYEYEKIYQARKRKTQHLIITNY